MKYYIRYKTVSEVRPEQSGTLGVEPFDSPADAWDYIRSIREGGSMYDFSPDDSLWVEDKNGGAHSG
jgi:hypothetical protein